MNKVGETEVAAAWDVNARTWAAEVRAGHDRTQELFTSPRFMEFVPDLAGLSVIDPAAAKAAIPGRSRGAGRA
jgi:hypothetical protein